MQHDDTEDARTVLLVRHAMDTASADLPPLPDLAGPAAAEGRRRTGRRRLALGTTALAMALAGAAATTLLPGTGAAPPVVTPAAAPSASAGHPEPVHIEPTPGEKSMADLPARERSRQVEFQNQAAGVLQALLPTGTGTVRRTDLNVSRYQVDQGGRTFVLVFSVRPSTRSASGPSCAEAKGAECASKTLPGGVKAVAVTAPVGSGTVTETRVRFHYGRSEVRLSLSPDEAAGVSAPVTGTRLLDVAGAPDFLDLVAYAERQPMEPLVSPVRGG